MVVGRTKIYMKEQSKKRKKFNKLAKLSRDRFYKYQLDLHINDQIKFWTTVGDKVGNASSQTIYKVIRQGADDLCNEEESINCYK